MTPQIPNQHLRTGSWAEKVRVSDSNTRCQLEQLERQPVGSILKIPNDMLMANGLPFPLWNKQGLSMAASMVGKPIACDVATLQCSRMDYARICIELDAAFPPVHQFQVDSSLTEDPITVEVVYEWKPARCHSCKVFGHSCKQPEAIEREEGKDHVQEMGETQLTQSKQKDKGKGKEKEPTVVPWIPSAENHGMMDNGGSDNPLGAEEVGTHHKLKVQKGQTTHGVQEHAQREQDHIDELPQCIESRMASISDGVDSRDAAMEATGSSTSSRQSGGQKGANTPSPQAKKKKGKKKRGATSPR
ncbi:hypothetical protein SADUNF_Sadunf03G0000200 [Salix dunnii]|uniref:DUF4283 domain-containing protein n=1 Tax=Salix dunnii TaxID=1413687 RepID=A0A835K659_9ROSI|nr:hypothetical protein SADUNF_Sadunf03G0000200 [Salix dunnii]